LIDQTQATVIKAAPKVDNKENRNSARILIDEKDASILQIEWEQESILGYEGKRSALRSEIWRPLWCGALLSG
jgi:hypothetical protein